MKLTMLIHVLLFLFTAGGVDGGGVTLGVLSPH